MAEKHPRIYIECSPELLDELHAANNALRGSKVRRSSVNVERLIVAIHNARTRAARTVEPAQAPPDASPAG